MIIDSRYRVINELGKGPWSRVYKVEDVRHNKIYALKLFDGVASSDFDKHFSPERMHHLTKIEHSNLIRVYNFGNYGQHIYYVSDYWQGDTLNDFSYAPAKLDLLYGIVVKLCYALSALHQQNLVHRLLKPSNIGYTVEKNELKVKIIDYGYTKVDFNREGALSEYLPYLAPEIFRMQPATPESDFYSLGAILYKITTGTFPFSEKGMQKFANNLSERFIPVFPRVINPDIPNNLENIIMKLLTMDKEERFHSAEEIIEAINQIPQKAYAFSQIKSMVSSIRLSDYIVREEYSHHLFEMMKIVNQGNGKLVTLYGGKGMGKTDALVLFRYHLLTGNYFIFDYNCSTRDIDPFFALIKEFKGSLDNNSFISEGMREISRRMNRMVFDGATKTDTGESDNLMRDFEVASQFLQVLSKVRPLVFTIRSCQYITEDVVTFLNYFSSKFLSKLRIIIILSVNDPSKLKGLRNQIEIRVDPLDLDATRVYIRKLLGEEPDEEFVRQMWRRSFGNPGFIESILIDMTNRELIWHDGKLNCKGVMDNYTLPEELLAGVYNKMSHLEKNTYLKLIRISAIKVPVVRELLLSVLDIEKDELYHVLADGKNNEILYEENKQIYFTYKESKERLYSECDEQERMAVSQKVIEFFSGKSIKAQGAKSASPLLVPLQRDKDELDDLETENMMLYLNNKFIDSEKTILGILAHGEMKKDLKTQRIYQKALSFYYRSQKKFDQAFLAMIPVIELDLLPELGQLQSRLREDIYILIEYTNWVDLNQIPLKFAKSINKMPDEYERNFLQGVFHFEVERNEKAWEFFNKALDHEPAGEGRMRALLYLGRCYVRLNKYDQLKIMLEELKTYEMEEEFELLYVVLQSFVLSHGGKIRKAINLIMNYLQHQAGSTKPAFYVEMGGLKINLGQLYNAEHEYNKEEASYREAFEIWKTVDYERKLGIFYNNMGDIALRKGKTVEAFKNFHNARNISKKVNNLTSLILSYLNYGEAYIKQGNFMKAEKNLEEARLRSEKLIPGKFWHSIIHNLAIARSKQHSFSYYRSFIAEHEPEVAENNFENITPLVKTWIYYLLQTGNFAQLDRIMAEKKNLLESKPEFYHQTRGNLHYYRKEFDLALKDYSACMEYAKQNNSEYATAIVNIYMARLNCQLGKIELARKNEELARELCQKNKFGYWKLHSDLVRQKIDLQYVRVNLRQIIRNMNAILKEAQHRNYFLIEIECYEVLLQIFSFLKKRSKMRYYEEQLRKHLTDAIRDLPEEEQRSYFELHNYDKKIPVRFPLLIADRNKVEDMYWAEELYELVKLNNQNRISFMMQKHFNELFAPYQMAAIQLQQLLNKEKPMLQQNVSMQELYSEEYLNYIHKSMDKNEIIQKEIAKRNVLFLPLRIKSMKKGVIILSDNGELPFQKHEIRLLSFLRLHITSMMMRGEEFIILNERIDLMDKLVRSTRNLFRIMSIKEVREDITKSAISIFNASRGFFITHESSGNYSYVVSIDESYNPISSYRNVAWEVLSKVARMQMPIFVNNKNNSDLVPQMEAGMLQNLEIYASPFFLDGELYGYLYLDNDNNEKKQLLINRDFTKLFFELMSSMLQNAKRHEKLHLIEMKSEQLNVQKDKFIQIVAHELHQPMSSLQSITRNIENFGVNGELRTKIARFKETSSKLTGKITEIIEHFSYLTKDKLDLKPVDLNFILDYAKERGKALSHNRHLFFGTQTTGGKYMIAADRSCLEQMMDKLLMNSIQYSLDKSLTIIGLRPAITIAEKVQETNSVILYVKDEGIGIKNKEHENIFKEFYEINDIYSHHSGYNEFNSSGLGLGLATVQRIVELHHGKIWVAENDQGNGATFFISLPLIQEQK